MLWYALGPFTRITGLAHCAKNCWIWCGNYTENLPTPGYFLGLTILFDADIAQRRGCGRADYNRHADCCDQLAFQWRERYSSTGRCRMCNQLSISTWINTCLGIRKGIRLPISGSEPAHLNVCAQTLRVFPIPTGGIPRRKHYRQDLTVGE